jgi:hypothetical protein
MTFVDGLREKWERWTPRERRLVVILGGTFVLFVAALVGRQIISGLSSLEDRNERARQALKHLEENRDDLVAARSKAGTERSVFNAEVPPLATYLEGIAKELAIQIPESTEKPGIPKGKFSERLVEVKLVNVTLAELAEFLRRVETNSPAVVTQRVLVMKSAFGTPEKLDSAELTIAAYERVKDAKAAANKGGEEQGEGKEP